MQDYNYWNHGCMEVTVELSCCKYPPVGHLRQIWEENKNSLLEYLKYAKRGVHGVIKYENGEPARDIRVQIDSRDPVFKTNENGEYYRILRPGTYTIRLLFDCDQFLEEKITIKAADHPNHGSLLIKNFTLSNKIFQYRSNKRNDNTNNNRYSIFCKSPLLPVKCGGVFNKSGVNSGNYVIPAASLNGATNSVRASNNYPLFFYLFFRLRFVLFDL
jgi:hypothetical protein